MKKVLFLQNEGNNFGGVWQVNKLVGEELVKHGYEVSIVSVRTTDVGKKFEEDTKMNVLVINDKETWGTYQGREILEEIKSFKIFNAFRMLSSRINYKIAMKKDVKKLQTYIREMNPDYVVTSQYELLDMVPREYLSRTINQQHSSFSDFSNHRATMNTFNKYNNKVKFLWLSKSTCESARKVGLNNCYYIYNAVRFKSDKTAMVVKNKKLITIARLAGQKDIGTMVEIVEEIFKDDNFKDWVLEIYGNGPEEEKIEYMIHSDRIKMMGPTDNPKKQLLKSSINLNTSLFEGFSMSILEAQECGVPTVSFNYWESVYEQIIDDKTGIIAKNKQDFIKKLKKLMLDKDKLQVMSRECKCNSKEFHIEQLIDEWIRLFDIVDKGNNCL